MVKSGTGAEYKLAYRAVVKGNTTWMGRAGHKLGANVKHERCGASGHSEKGGLI